jgi:hypothetical protein
MSTADVTAANAIDPSSVVGWGVDNDPDNDPTYPMRDRSREDKGGMNWPRPPQQQPQVEILRSVEHVRLPAAFGTASPPKGLSGAIRRLAFRWSESQLAHWLLLIFADRVNVVEGNIADLFRGRLPNHYREMGLGASWEHDKSRFLIRGAIGVAAVAVVAVGVTVLLTRD